MDIRNNGDALRAFLGVPSSPATSTQAVRNGDRSAVQTALAGDQATVSQAGAEVSQVTAQDGVRREEVAAIQQALATGTYSVPAGKVADKVIDAMLAGGLESTK